MNKNSKQLLKIAREVNKIASSKQFQFNKAQYQQLVKIFNSNGFKLKGEFLQFAHILKLQYMLNITLLTNGDVTISIEDTNFIGIIDIGDTTIEYLKGLMNDYKTISSFYNELVRLNKNFANELFTKVPLSVR